MATTEQVAAAIEALPDDIRSKLSGAPDEKKDAFINELSAQLDSSSGSSSADETQKSPNTVDTVLNIFPAYQVGKAVVSGYKGAKEGLVNSFLKAPIMPGSSASIDTFLSDKKVPITRDNPIKYLLGPAGELLPKIHENVSSREFAKDTLGTGVDFAAGEGAAKLLSVTPKAIEGIKKGASSVTEFLTKPSALEQLRAQKTALDLSKDSVLKDLGAEADNIASDFQAKFGKGSIDSLGNKVPSVKDAAQLADQTAINTKYETLKNEAKLKLENIDNTELPMAAHKQTLQTRGDVVDLLKDTSERFGKAYDAVPLKVKDITVQRLSEEVLNPTLKEAGLISDPGVPPRPLSPSEKKLVDYANNLQDMEGTTNLDVRSVEKDLRGLLASKTGKYGSGDHVFTILKKNMMESIYADNPGLIRVRGDFKPLLQVNNEAVKTFQPFARSGEADTQKAIEFFKRYANGSRNSQGVLIPDEQYLANAMKTKLGDNVFEHVDSVVNSKKDLIRKAAELDQLHQSELVGNKAGLDTVAERAAGNYQVKLSENAAKQAAVVKDHALKASDLDTAIKNAEKTQKLKNVAKLVGAGGVGALTEKLINR